jgi:Family of unknown function (DUF6913)
MSELINKFKRWWLKRKYGKSEVSRTFTTVQKASRLGVLYKADQEYSTALIKKLTKWCEINNFRLLAMGYVNDKELSSHYSPHRNSDFFCNKHLNRWNLPEKSEFIRYSNEKMDYLLNLYCEPCLPLLGISSFVENGFRVGPYLPKFAFSFDLMLNTKTTDILVFTDEVLSYLTTFGDGKI